MISWNQSTEVGGNPFLRVQHFKLSSFPLLQQMDFYEVVLPWKLNISMLFYLFSEGEQSVTMLLNSGFQTF